MQSTIKTPENNWRHENMMKWKTLRILLKTKQEFLKPRVKKFNFELLKNVKITNKIFKILSI